MLVDYLQAAREAADRSETSFECDQITARQTREIGGHELTNRFVGELLVTPVFQQPAGKTAFIRARVFGDH